VLIVPLHRRLTRETFPFATAALILINVFVFLFLQDSGMSSETMQRRMDASKFYQSSGLIDIELPAYRATLQQRGGSDDALDGLDDAPGPVKALMVSSIIDNDYRFLAEFDSPDNFNDAESHAHWRNTRDQYEAKRGSSFTRDWVLRYGEWEPARMFGAAFLHGSIDHLVGNMIFLALLGLLVELALGPWRFLLLYLVGAFGASAGCLLWRGNEVGAMLGASGAIAALMGAFAVIWAGREVRVFYWFFVAFNYVKVQALWLLPLWLGWEVYNLLFNSDAGISFETHAGGIIAGALCAFAFTRLDWVRHEQMDEESKAPEVDHDEQLQQALSDMGAMRLEAAEATLQTLHHQHPDDQVVQLARLRCARLGGHRQRANALAEAMLEQAGSDSASLDRQLEVLRELRHLKLDAEPATRCRLAQRLLAGHRSADAESVVEGLSLQDDARLPSLWLALGNARLQEHRFAAARSHLNRIIDNAPRSAEANKARFLLAEMPPDRSAPASG